MEEQKRIATVSQLNAYIKQVLDRNPHLSNLWIKGEISNFKLHYSGHAYMTLKDAGGVLKAIMFKSSMLKLSFVPKDGMRVLARGRISVFERDGQYQLYVEAMEQDGIGNVYERFEEMKKRLSEEGLFSDEFKKPLPAYPSRIGVVTAATGAAIRDILNVLNRRCRLCDVIIYPVLVQGEAAAGEIAAAIDYFNKTSGADVLIVGRGGGSIEDLWAFNEELVARTVFNSKIPVISAVGHEVDFTICDFVADLRAPTPSAAAELAVQDERELKQHINQINDRMKYSISKRLENRRQVLKGLTERPVFMRFWDNLAERGQLLDSIVKQLQSTMSLRVSGKQNDFASLAGRLDSLSPLKVMERGYAVPTNAEGSLVRSVKQVSYGDELSLRLYDGSVDCKVIQVEGSCGDVCK